MEWIIKKELSYTSLNITLTKVGDDYHILLQGGDRPHIGCTVLAIPRPSLTGNGEMSCTASVLNVTGHKDEYVCRLLAENLCTKTGATVVCTGGFHMDGITKEQMAELMMIMKQQVVKEIDDNIDREK